MRKNLFYGLMVLVAFVSFNLQLILYLRIDSFSVFVETVDVFHFFSYFCLSVFLAAGIYGFCEILEKLISYKNKVLGGKK